jgi:hypothetical protein
MAAAGFGPARPNFDVATGGSGPIRYPQGSIKPSVDGSRWRKVQQFSLAQTRRVLRGDQAQSKTYDTMVLRPDPIALQVSQELQAL